MFEDIIKPIESESFLLNYYQKKHLFIKRNKTDYYNEIFNYKLLDLLLFSTTNYYPFFKVVNHSKDRISPAKYCNKIYDDKFVIDPEKFVEHYENGNTLILTSIQNKVLSLKNLTNAFDNFFKHLSGTNIYITPKNSQGFPPHYDTHDVFVLQVNGSKNWRIYSGGIENPNTDMKFDNNHSDPGEIVEEFTLNSGDFLYIPRGVVHDAYCASESSIHITLGLFGKTWSDFIAKAIMSKAKHYPVLRRYPRLDKNDFDTFNSQDKNMISKIIADIINEIEIFIDQENNKELVAHHRSTNLGYFEQVFELENLSDSSFISKNPNKDFKYYLDGEKIIVHNSTEKITLPSACEDFIKKLDEIQNNQLLKDIKCSFDEESKLSIVKLLIQMQFFHLDSTK